MKHPASALSSIEFEVLCIILFTLRRLLRFPTPRKSLALSLPGLCPNTLQRCSTSSSAHRNPKPTTCPLRPLPPHNAITLHFQLFVPVVATVGTVGLCKCPPQRLLKTCHRGYSPKCSTSATPQDALHRLVYVGTAQSAPTEVVCTKPKGSAGFGGHVASQVPWPLSPVQRASTPAF